MSQKLEYFATIVSLIDCSVFFVEIYKTMLSTALVLDKDLRQEHSKL